LEIESLGGSRLRVQLDHDETALMAKLIDEMRSVLGSTTTDEVRSRLFPDAYDDRKEADAYKEMVGGELEKLKLEALSTVENGLGDGETDVALEADEVDAWLRAVTDLRLAIGTRLGVTHETMENELDPRAPDAAGLAVLHWLGWMQESLLSELTGVPAQEH
jgi:Domain of unknown function (DUF2017)